MLPPSRARRTYRWRPGPPGHSRDEGHLAPKAFAETMSAYALTPLAKADIFEIWSYIAEDSTARRPFVRRSPCPAHPGLTIYSQSTTEAALRNHLVIGFMIANPKP